MLLLLMPEQVTRYWEDIKEGLERALPPGPSDREVKLLVGLQVGRNQCWITYHKEADKTTVDGCAITALINDQVHETRNLLLYALWAIGDTHKTTWDEGMEALKKYARSKNCSRIVGYADQENVIGLCKATGGEARYTFCTWDV